MSWRLVSLEMEGFKAFKENCKITFPESGLVLISGRSGSGKSSILEAIAFAFDVCELPATELKGWEARKMLVKLVVTNGQDTCEITRDPKLSLVINGVAYESMTTGAKEKLQSILKSSPEIIKAITYRPQRQKGQFMNSTDSALKDFLTQPLGLNELEAAAEHFTREANQAFNSIDVLKQSKASMQFQTFTPVTDEQIAQAKKDLDEAAGNLSRLTQNTQKDELIKELHQVTIELDKSVAVSRQSDASRNQNAVIREQIIGLQTEIEKLSSQLCPTCERSWEKSAAVLELKRNQIAGLVQQFEVNIAVVKNSQVMVDNIPNLKNRQQAVNLKLGELSAPENIVISSHTLAKSRYEFMLAQKSNNDRHLARMHQLDSDIKALEIKYDIYANASKMVGRQGFMGNIFDEMLRAIEARANDMIEYIPNIAHLSLKISSTKIAKKGTAKKEIAINIIKDGKEVSFKSLSGGQQCAIELCTDLASAEVIRARAGDSMNWICLDETMGGFGVEETQAAINMIKERVKGVIFIIDHHTEVKEGFEKVIQVEYNGKESHVVG